MKISKTGLVVGLGGVLTVALVIGAAVKIGGGKEKNQVLGEYDSLAQCLNEKGVKMFGAYWCSHCQSQKKMFGSSWQYIDYVECSLAGGSGQTKECREAGVESYPTWEFGDGERLTGEVSLDVLREKSGCGVEERE